MTWEVKYTDCVEGMKKYIDSKSVDMVFADPPFGIKFDKRSDDIYSRKKENRVEGYVEIRANDYYDFCFAWMHEVARIIKPGGTIHIVSGWTNTHIIEWVAVEELDWFKMNKIIWHYSNPLPFKKRWRAAHYEISVFTPTELAFKQTKHTFNIPTYQTQPLESVWYIKRDMTAKKYYTPNATKLPDELVQRCLLASSNEKDLVVDPFVGNGTTPAMCVKHNRNFIGFEVNKNAKKTIEYIVGREEEMKKSKNTMESFFK